MEMVDAVDGYKFADESTSDVRVCFRRTGGRGEQPERFPCHSSVLSNRSKYFADLLGQQSDARSGGSNNCIEVQCPRAEYDHYVKLLKFMYLSRDSIEDAITSVKSALGVLRAATSLKSEFVAETCIGYLESASWEEKEEEEILQFAQTLAPEAAAPLLARLQAPSANAVKTVFISAVRFAASMETSAAPLFDDIKTAAQEQIDFMLHDGDDPAIVMMDEDVRSVLREGLTKLLSTLRTGLDLLASEFDKLPEQAEQRIVRSLVDIDWITTVLTKTELMNEFVSGWLEISDHVVSVVQNDKYSSGLWAVKTKLIEVTGKALDAVGYGSVILPSTSRAHLVKTWLPYIRTTKRFLDAKAKDEAFPQMDAGLCQNIESAIVSLILALPSGDQSDILSDWMQKADQFRYPDLTEAFEMWCYRSKTAIRRLNGAVDKGSNPISLLRVPGPSDSQFQPGLVFLLFLRTA
ncbi:unnamed protein product [Triticum turgidum subsp. durum]|uniref:BTB domain-containing protein n=4 Tax=Triticum TaxID=4564 RepID=A0A9R0W4W3_TRITD|nr:unnamed protein product [Triticum turgidum subsp. durum]